MNCLFCAGRNDDEFKAAEKKKPLDQHTFWYNVRSFAFIQKVLEFATERGDQWGQKIEEHINAAGPDLMAKEDHHRCYKKFSNMPTQKKIRSSKR